MAHPKTLSPLHVLLASAASLGAAGCSGGGGVSFPSAPTAVTFSSSAGSSAEGTTGAVLSVSLVTQLPETTSTISVMVTDLGTGTATPGTDYVAFPPTAVVFPEGSISGETVLIDLTTLPDTLAEGADETVRFGLSGATNAVIVGASEAPVTIQDASSAAVVFSSGSTVSPDEASTSYSVDATLQLTPGSTLGFDAVVTVSDDGSGDASSGVDYAAFSSQVITFPAGAVNGASETLSLQVLDDSDSEGMEFFAIHMTGEGLTQLDRSGITRHTFYITDDEAAATAALNGRSGPTGTETPHAGAGEALNLGTTLLNGTGTIGTLLELSNLGSQPMSLGQPLLIGGDQTDFVVEVESASMESGTRSAAGLTPPSEFADLGAPFQRLGASAAPGTSANQPADDGLPGLSLTVDEASLADLVHVDRVRLHGFPLPGGLGDVTLELERIPVPITSDAVLYVNGQAVPGGPRSLLSDLTNWRGRAVEIPGSRAFVSFTTAGGPQGYLKLPFGENSTVHLCAESPATGSSPATCRIVHEADLAALPAAERPALCGGQRLVPGRSIEPQTKGSPSTSAMTQVANCRLAIETDTELYDKLGSSVALTDYVTSLVAAISDQYFEDVQTTLSIAYLGIHDGGTDPWTTEAATGDAEDMLDEFRAAWTGSNSWPVSADLAHFLSGKNLGGGIAYVDVLCDNSFGFGVSANLNGNINWGTWTGNAGSFTWDFVVFAHELGHNFGASHTHEYCPPIDICYAGCQAGTACSQGTLMSYCHTCGGIDNIDLHFDQRISDIMRTRVDASCLGDAMMQSGDSIRYRLRFDPRSSTGAKSTTLRFDHSAPNAPDPYEITLTGTAN